MFGNRSFLMLGSAGGTNILDLMKGGLEIMDYNFSIYQGIDDKGKATTRTAAGSINLTISQLPNEEIIEWALNSRKYLDGCIVLLDGDNSPVEKIVFKNAACVNFDITYAVKGTGYAATRLSIQAEAINMGDGDDNDFSNEWVR